MYCIKTNPAISAKDTHQEKDQITPFPFYGISKCIIQHVGLYVPSRLVKQ